jgi:hypothetical protein
MSGCTRRWSYREECVSRFSIISICQEKRLWTLIGSFKLVAGEYTARAAFRFGLGAGGLRSNLT